MEPTICKPGAYKSPGIYNGAGGVYNGRGVYNDGAGGGSPVPPIPPEYTQFKYLENKHFSSGIAAYCNIFVPYYGSFEINMEFPNGVENNSQWIYLFYNWGINLGVRFSNYGGRAIQSGFNSSIESATHINAPNNDYNDFLDNNKQIKIIANKDKIIINGIEYINDHGAEVESLSINLGLQSHQTCLMRLMSIIIRDANDQIIEMAVPAKDPDGKSGIYKLFEQTFRNNDVDYIAKD